MSDGFLNHAYKVGHVNKKAKKTVNLNVNVKKGLEEGYYPILIYISKRAQGEDGMSSEYAKTIMAWIETKKTTGTSETDEDSSEPGSIRPRRESVHSVCKLFRGHEFRCKREKYRL